MFFAASNKPKKLLYMTFVEHVTAGELKRAVDDVKSLLLELPSGFNLLVDCSRLDSMDLDCAPEIGNVMEMNDKKGVSLIVRVIPDPQKDIGLGILTSFHYHHKPRVATCETMAEAAELLSL